MTDVGDEALDLLDIGEVATRLRVSKSTVRRLIASGDLESVKIGVRVLVAPEAIIEYKQRLREVAHAEQSGKPAA
jgi:excisionase family DNA binding protein